MRASEYRTRIRFALAQLNAANGHFVFERLCLAHARTYVSDAIVSASGPVAGRGDQGRDFETYPTRKRHEGRLAEELDIAPGEDVVFLCTLQRKGLAAKFSSDVTKAIEGATRPDILIAYCEANIAVGERHRIEQAVSERFAVRFAILDGNAIADDLSRAPALREVVLELLHVGDSLEVRVPRQLPTPPIRFANRKNELSKLDLLAEIGLSSGPAVALVTGMPGVGKSATVATWSARRGTRFAGGALYVDLSRAGAYPDISEALGEFVMALGVAHDAVPSEFDQRRELFGELTSHRQVLVVVDNATHAAQVLPLVPRGSGSVLIATSTAYLDELIIEGAQLIDLAPLATPDAHAMLQEFVDPLRLDNHDAVGSLVKLCDGLPVALAVCAAQLNTHPHWTVGDLVDRIQQATDPLDSVASGARYSIAAAFEAAYVALAPTTARLYRRLSIHFEAEFSTSATTALIDGDPQETAELLEELRSVHLIEGRSNARWAVHSLIRHHMRRVMLRDEPAGASRAATERLVEWYADRARSADWSVVADRFRLGSPPALDTPGFSSPGAAHDWFETERTNLMSAQRIAAELGFDRLVWGFAESLWPWCATMKRFGEWIMSHELGAAAAGRCIDAGAEARVRSQLARAYAELGRSGDAERETDRAVELAGRSGSAFLGASVSEFAGVCAAHDGRFEQALRFHEVARPVMAALGSARGVALQDYYSGVALARLGRYADAMEKFELARPVLLDCGDDITATRIGVRVGEILFAQGLLEEAVVTLNASIKVATALGLKFECAQINEQLGTVLLALERPEEARRPLQLAYHGYRDLHHPQAEQLERALADRAA